MNRPKEVKYMCVSSGCLGDKCHSCEMAELWRYIKHLESLLEQTDTKSGVMS